MIDEHLPRATGRYRFRRGLFGICRILQAEWLTDIGPDWRDVHRGIQHERRIFAIAHPSELGDLRSRVEKADKKAEQQRKARALKRGDKPEFAESRFVE